MIKANALVVTTLASSLVLGGGLVGAEVHAHEQRHQHSHEHQHADSEPAEQHHHTTEHNHSQNHDHSHEHSHDHDHHHDDEFTQLGAHVHGEALLTFVLEGNEAILALQTAAYNIVGFEHAPSTDEQEREIQAALAMLSKGSWFELNRDTGCQVEQADSSTDLTRPGHQNHGDFYANFTLLCHNPARLQYLDLSLIQLMPALERVQVQWVVNERQGMSTATLREGRIRF
ncbi:MULTISPECIES: ZrgA family zinc uptake protein [Alkalimonas]|uniref:DUF2796 domain-containing protein n=1 Tax=Alkalimonas mucilaginosa TaxID=3057676 RepID=A0ABU7JG38_9GAMM|nr:DUF2796 domain-containing protein [Alkalimonas sp. MEB004]MEE2024639.1 DUF2796 domain-containing protein [Alkalimonas sp. MEB004]